MSDNVSEAREALGQILFESVLITQILAFMFISTNLVLLATVFSKPVFYSTMRYILFTITLVSDSITLIISDLLLLLNVFRVPLQVSLCIVCYLIVLFCGFITPVTLTAMTLERYVAICLPLQHPRLCSLHNTWNCMLIINALSCVPCFIILSSFFAAAPSSVYKQYKLCSMEMFVAVQWQKQLKFSVYQSYFVIMFVTITLSYVKIMKIAKAASEETKMSTFKGLKTVILHSFQLLLCLIQLWCPFIESVVFENDKVIFSNVRFFNYIVFYIAPRCLSPLIYGLRDEKIFLALKVRVLFLRSW